MAISKTRKAIRVVLVLLLCLVVWGSYRGWQQLGPEQQWLRAQAKIEAGDYESAEILIKSVLRATPDHPPAHLAMGNILLQRARKDGAEATFATRPEAQRQLDKAWELMPEDPAIRAAMLEFRVETGRMEEAADIANEVLSDDPDNAVALYAITWLKVRERKPKTAGKFLERLLEQPGEPQLRTLLLSVQRARLTDDREVLRHSLEQVVAVAKNPPPNLKPREAALLDELVQMSIQDADSALLAEERLNIALDWLQRDVSGKSATAARALAMASAASKWYQPGVRPTFDKALWPRVRDLMEPSVNWEPPQPQAVATLVVLAFACGETDTGVELASHGIDAFEGTEHSDTLRQLHLMTAVELIAHKQYSSARVHLAPLMADEKSSGWGFLLAGGIAMTNGQFETALKYHEVAESKLGNAPFVAYGIGRNLVSLKQWDRAVKYLRPLVPDFPGDVAELHLLIAQSLLGLGDTVAADRHLRELRGTTQEASGIALQSVSLFNGGQQPQALEMLQTARERFTDDKNLAWLQALILLRTERADEGERAITEFAAAHPDDVASQLLLIRWLETAGRNSDALQQVKSLEERFADDPRVLFAKAQILLMTGDSSAAQEVAAQLQNSLVTEDYDRQVSTSPALPLNDPAPTNSPQETLSPQQFNTEAGLIEAAVLSIQGQHDQVVQHLGSMLDTTGPESKIVSLLYRSLNTLAEQTDPAHAEARLDGALRRYGTEPLLLMAKADFQARQNRFDEAMATLGKMAAVETNSARPFILRAQLLGRRQEFSAALAELEQGLQREPDNKLARAWAAIFAASSGEFQRCLDHTVAGLNAHPQESAFVILKAASLNGLKRTDEALPMLVALTEREPANAAGWVTLANLELTSGSAEQAVQTLAEGRKHAPTDGSLLRSSIALLCGLQRIGDAMAVAREADAAIPAFATRLQLASWFRDSSQLTAARLWANEALKEADPQQTRQALTLLGEMAKTESRANGGDAGLLAEARKYFQHVLNGAEEPVRSAMWVNLGDVSVAQGHLSGEGRYYQAAREYYARVLEEHPQHIVAGNNLARLLLQNLDEPEQALVIAEQVRGGKPGQELNLSFVDTLSHVYRKVNRMEDAQRLLTEALAANPRHPDLHFELGHVYLDTDPSASREAFQNALACGLSAEREKEARLRLAELQRK